jgi:hypothetical protein
MAIHIRRREFITGTLGGAAVALPLVLCAQQAERMRHIGVLMNLAESDPETWARRAAFLQALQEFGWSEGRNVRLDYRWGVGDPDRHRKNAAQLVALEPRYHPGPWKPHRETVAPGDSHRADRVRECRRSGRRRLRR